MGENELKNFAIILENENLDDSRSVNAIKEMLKQENILGLEYKIYDINSGKLEETREVFTGPKSNEKPLVLDMKSHRGRIRTEFKIYPAGEITEENKVLMEDLCASIFVILENDALLKIINSNNNFLVDGMLSRDVFVDKALEKIRENKGVEYYSLVVAITDFDAMRRLYGEEKGEEIVKGYAKKLVSLCDEQELVGHRGNDKFAMLIKKENKNKLDELMEKYEMKLEIDGKEVSIIINAYAGVSTIDSDSATYEKLIVEPRLALSYGVNNGIKMVKITNEIRDRMLNRRRIEDSFADALEKEYIKLWFQPKIDIRTDKIVGVEALARWIEPDRKYFPNEFVPILEESGLIKELDFYVLERACKYMAEWRKAGHDIVPLSVNFSRVNLEDLNLAYKINEIIEKYHIKKNQITVEITETASEKMKDKMRYFLDTMHEYGIQTSVDDFGTGYASLSILRDFTMDEIKIDKSFIDAPVFQNKYRIIVEGIVEMAKSLGMKVIVEGVETELQKEFLKEVGCYYVQGYLYDKPLPRDEFEERLVVGYN